MSTMDSNLLHHPIKFSIKTNDLEKLKKKPDKSFFKIDIAEPEVDNKVVKVEISKQGTSNELGFPPEEVLKGRPLICDNVIFEKIKKPTKRTHQPELDQESIKQRKIEEKDQVIIEPETSSALVIRGLPRSVAPPTVSKEQSILQIFSKCKDVITNKLEEKIDLIDRICQSGTCDITLSKDNSIHSSQQEVNRKANIKQSTENKIVTKNENASKILKSDKVTTSTKKSDLKNEISTKNLHVEKVKNKDDKFECRNSKGKKDSHIDDALKKSERSNLKSDSNKPKEEIHKSKIITEGKSKVDGITKKIEESDASTDKGVIKEKISDSRTMESRRSSHRRLSPDKTRRSSKNISPLKSDRHSRPSWSDNRHKSRTRSNDRRRYGRSKSPRKSRGYDSRHDESKSHRSVRSLQMGPLSLRDEFLLETERVVVNPEEQLEESFNCNTAKVPVKDKRNIAERLQRLFNKTKITEEQESTKIKVDETVIVSSFQPEDPINSQITSEISDHMSLPQSPVHTVSKTQSLVSDSPTIIQSELTSKQPISDDINQSSREKVSFIIPLTKIVKNKSISADTNKWFNPKDLSKSLLSKPTERKQEEKDLLLIARQTKESETNNESLPVAVSQSTHEKESPEVLSVNVRESEKISTAKEKTVISTQEASTKEQINIETRQLSSEKVSLKVSSRKENENQSKSTKHSQRSKPSSHDIQKQSSSNERHRKIPKPDTDTVVRKIVSDTESPANLPSEVIGNQVNPDKTQKMSIETILVTDLVTNLRSEVSNNQQITVESQNLTPEIITVKKPEEPPINSWAQESSHKTLKQDIVKIEPTSTDNQQWAHGKVSFMISPRKVLTIQSPITIIPKLSLQKESSTNQNPIVLVKSSESQNPLASNNISTETNPTSDLKSESITLEPEKSTPQETERSKIVVSHCDNDLNLFVISQSNEERKLDEDSRTMHIEKTVIMEPLSKTCNISFRIKTNEKQLSNAFSMTDSKEIYSSVKNIAIEMVEIKPLKKEDESPITLSNVLDNLIQTKPTESLKVNEDEINQKGIKIESLKICTETKVEKNVMDCQNSVDRSTGSLKCEESKSRGLKSEGKSVDKSKSEKCSERSRDKSTHSRNKAKDEQTNSTMQSKPKDLSKTEIKASRNDKNSLTHSLEIVKPINTQEAQKEVFEGETVAKNDQEKVLQASTPAIELINQDSLLSLKSIEENKSSKEEIKSNDNSVLKSKDSKKSENTVKESINVKPEGNRFDVSMSEKKIKDFSNLKDREKSKQSLERTKNSTAQSKDNKRLRSPSKETRKYSENLQNDSKNEDKSTFLKSTERSKDESKYSKDGKTGKDDIKLEKENTKSIKKFRQANYRNRSTKESKSPSRDRRSSKSSIDTVRSAQKFKRNRDYLSPKRKWAQTSDHRRSRNRSKDNKRTFRSRSRHSKKRKISNSRSNSRKKSNDKTRRRRRSNSTRRSITPRGKYRRFRENSAEKRRHLKSNERSRNNKRPSRSRSKYTGKRKLSKSHSRSRKNVKKGRKSSSKFRYSSDSSKDSIKSKDKSKANKYDVKSKIKENSPKDSCRDRKSKERVDSKKLGKSKEKSKSLSKSQDPIKTKARSKSFDNHPPETVSTIGQTPTCSLQINLESNVEEKSLCTNSDEKTLTCDPETDANQTKLENSQNQLKDKSCSVIVTEKPRLNTGTTLAANDQSDIKIVIKERSCAEKCMLNFLNRHIQSKPEMPMVYKTEVASKQFAKQNYYPPPSSSVITTESTSNHNYFINSQHFHQNQTPVYSSVCAPSVVHNNYSSHSIYQPTPYPNYYPPQHPSTIYQSQSYDNHTQSYPNHSVKTASYVTPPQLTQPFTINNPEQIPPTSQLNSYDHIVKEYDISTYQTPPPPPPPTPPLVHLAEVSESKIVEEEIFCLTRNSSNSSLSNSLIDMDMATLSFKSIDSNVGLKLGDDVSINDDLSSCEEFEYEDLEPQDPFQKYVDAPRPEYEHIIQTEVHVSAVGKRFEYAYLKSTSCNCIPPNPDEIRMGKAACDENCFNRKIKVECNRNCPVYDLCTNRRFQEQIYSPIEPFYSSPDKGWGIRSLSNIPLGRFVIEYVGELIDCDEFFKRINQRTTHNHHFMMVIQKDMYIDAGNKGNWARFVNHSCDPNTIIERWVVNGKTRIGFFSKKPIAKDEEITIDYQFQQYGSIEQKCFCASANCTGIMGKFNEKLQEQIKMSASRHRKDLIQRIISRKSLKEINHVSEMITVIKDNTLDRDTFFSFLEVLQRTSSHLCIRTFIECGGLNIITSYLDTISWNDWPLKLLYLQCLDHFKLKKRTLINSGFTSATVVDYWAENPRYETKHIAEDSLNIDSFNDDNETNSDSLEESPVSNQCPIIFSLPTTEEAIDDIEKQIQSLALKCKEYFGQEKEKFFIPKIKGNPIEFSAEFSTYDSESKSISIASSVQGDFVQMKTRKLRNKCNEVIQKLPKEEFRRIFSENYNRSLAEKNQSLATIETNDNRKNAEMHQKMKQILSTVIIEEINNLRQNEQFSSMPVEFQTSDIDKILSSLNFVEKEGFLSLSTPQQDDTVKSGSLSNYSKSSDDGPKGDQDSSLLSTDQLPPNWRFCRSAENGRIYFYHTISKKTQWETPIYPWDAGDDDPSSYDFSDAHEFQVTVEDVKSMLQRNKLNYREEKLQERQRRRLERTLQRKLSLSAGERNKIQFSREVFKAVKALMKPYFSSSCKIGRVKSKPDLKFLCEKFADTIIGKEVKLVASLEDLELNSDVSSKIGSYVTKYMSNQGRYFKRSKKPKIKPNTTDNSKADSVGSSTPNFSL